MTCWFCGVAEAHSNKAVRLHMYGEIQSFDEPVNKKFVEYTTQIIDVPRCADCKKKHGIARFRSILAGLMVAAMLASGLCALTSVPDWIWAFALGLSIGFFVLFLSLRSIALKGIKKESAAKKVYPEVVDLLDKKCKFGKRPSYGESIKPNGSVKEKQKKE